MNANMTIATPKTHKAPTGTVELIHGRARSTTLLATGLPVGLMIETTSGAKGYYTLSPEKVCTRWGWQQVGWQLVKEIEGEEHEGEVYHLPLDVTACDCPDAKYRNRECRHMRAVAAVLKACGWEG